MANQRIIYFRGLLVAGGFLGILLALWGLYVGFEKGGPHEDSIQVLDRLERDGIPEFSLPDLNGHQFEIKSLKGKVIVLNFWATWCAPCVEEFPSLIQMVKTFGGSVALVTVAADEHKEDIQRFIQALKLENKNWVSLWDPQLVVAKQFGTQKLPETFILDRQFKVVKKVVNSVDWNSDAVLHYLGDLQKN